jgi:hypothetical protein
MERVHMLQFSHSLEIAGLYGGKAHRLWRVRTNESLEDFIIVVWESRMKLPVTTHAVMCDIECLTVPTPLPDTAQQHPVW